MNSTAGIFGTVPEPRMREFIASQRWFGAKNREIAEFVVLDEIDLASGPGSLVMLSDSRFASAAGRTTSTSFSRGRDRATTSKQRWTCSESRPRWPG